MPFSLACAATWSLSSLTRLAAASRSPLMSGTVMSATPLIDTAAGGRQRGTIIVGLSFPLGNSHSGDPRVQRLIGKLGGPGLNGCHRTRDREPATHLVVAVAGQFDLLVRHVQNLLEVTALQHAEEPVVELLVDVADPWIADPMREAAGTDDGDSLQPVVGPDRVTQRLAELVRPADRHQLRNRAVLHLS